MHISILLIRKVRRFVQAALCNASLCNTSLSLRLPQPPFLNIEGDEVCQGLDVSNPHVLSKFEEVEAAKRLIMSNQDL